MGILGIQSISQDASCYKDLESTSIKLISLPAFGGFCVKGVLIREMEVGGGLYLLIEASWHWQREKLLALTEHLENQPWAAYFTCVVSFKPRRKILKDAILQPRILSLWEVKRILQGHIARKCQSQKWSHCTTLITNALLITLCLLH